LRFDFEYRQRLFIGRILLATDPEQKTIA